MLSLSSLFAGAAAGTTVDVLLFPLDTVKTRLQSKEGFWKTGGFRGIYRGIGPLVFGSAPSASMFFMCYDTFKIFCYSKGMADGPMVHMMAASIGEIAACMIRVPCEVLKQRQQVSQLSANEILAKLAYQETMAGLYRGYFSTLIREIPFSIIQFPIWEILKKIVKRQKGEVPSPFESSLCGAVAGGIAAAITTPLDVAKTRIMLAKPKTLEARGNVYHVLRLVHHEKGMKGLFAGIVPRTMWISIGGCVFFGTYEYVKSSFS